jgi:hypothetical protein
MVLLCIFTNSEILFSNKEIFSSPSNMQNPTLYDADNFPLVLSLKEKRRATVIPFWEQCDASVENLKDCLAEKAWLSFLKSTHKFFSKVIPSSKANLKMVFEKKKIGMFLFVF